VGRVDCGTITPLALAQRPGSLLLQCREEQSHGAWIRPTGLARRRRLTSTDRIEVGIIPTPTRTLRSTNAIESMISICRTHGSNVKRWRDRLSPSSTVHSLDCDATSRRISARQTQASKVTYNTRLGDHIDVLGHPVLCCLICALCVTLCVPSTHRDKLVTLEDDAVCQESRLLLEDRQEAGPCLLNYFQTYQKRLCVSETSGNVIPRPPPGPNR
jgi:hypothetical protein